jgi:hypothetical protein
MSISVDLRAVQGEAEHRLRTLCGRINDRRQIGDMAQYADADWYDVEEALALMARPPDEETK